MSTNNKVKTRFAPSPTGKLHIGSARTALFNFLFAKKEGGVCILRIEDTDKTRSDREYEDDILEGLKWLGIVFTETYKQSGRADTHKKYIKILIENNFAYVSKENAKDGSGSVEVIRFKNPNKEILFTDSIRGEIKTDTTDLGDFVIAKDINSPLYHLATVVDDMESNITHIVRGEDGISNTPRQILIQEALGATTPQYAHLPLILGKDKSKLSKRHGEAISISDLRELGYLKESVINYLALLGWNPGDDREMFTIEELCKEFSINKIQKGGAIFDIEKLKWINRQYIKKNATNNTKTEEIISYIKKYFPGKDENIYKKLVPVAVERIDTYTDIKNIDFEYFFTAPDYDSKSLMNPNSKSGLSEVKIYLEHIINALENTEDNHFNENKENIKNLLWDYATEKGRGDVLWPFRFALTGQNKSPDPFLVSWIIGKKETIKRLTLAIEKI